MANKRAGRLRHEDVKCVAHSEQRQEAGVVGRQGRLLAPLGVCTHCGFFSSFLVRKRGLERVSISPRELVMELELILYFTTDSADHGQRWAIILSTAMTKSGYS